MLFEEAVKELVKGNYVTRNGWEAGTILALLPGMPCAWQIKTVPNPAAGNWQALMIDYTADDWKLVSRCHSPEVEAASEAVAEEKSEEQADAA